MAIAENVPLKTILNTSHCNNLQINNFAFFLFAQKVCNKRILSFPLKSLDRSSPTTVVKGSTAGPFIVVVFGR